MAKDPRHTTIQRRSRPVTAVLNPYLNFTGQAREAMNFYQSVFGGEVSAMTFEQVNPNDEKIDPVDANKIMHSQLETPAGFTLMASDVPQAMQPMPNGGISLSGDSADELRGYWEKLTDHAQVLVPLSKQAWGDEFGMLIDKFGVNWLMNISGPR
nr:VOC family protein [Flexivirga meconopsidis]